jgi:hypothetical protein
MRPLTDVWPSHPATPSTTSTPKPRNDRMVRLQRLPSAKYGQRSGTSERCRTALPGSRLTLEGRSPRLRRSVRR